MKLHLLAAIALIPTLASAQTPIPNTSDLSQLVNATVAYEFNPQAVGLLARVQIGSVRKFGFDIDSLAGLAAPTKKLSLGGKAFSDLTGQIGFGGSWSWTVPKTSYFARVGVGVLMMSGGEPIGSIYVMAGVR